MTQSGPHATADRHAYQQRAHVLAQYPLGLLDDACFIHDEEQCPHAFSCEQLFLPGETSLQLPLLLLLLGECGELEAPLLEGLLAFGEAGGEAPLLEGLLAFGEAGAGPSKALTCKHSTVLTLPLNVPLGDV